MRRSQCEFRWLYFHKTDNYFNYSSCVVSYNCQLGHILLQSYVCVSAF